MIYNLIDYTIFILCFNFKKNKTLSIINFYYNLYNIYYIYFLLSLIIFILQVSIHIYNIPILNTHCLYIYHH